MSISASGGSCEKLQACVHSSPVYNTMQEQEVEERNPLEKMGEDTERLNFQERYIRWQAFLTEKRDDPRIGQYLEKFIESFPFNASYWILYAQEELKKGKPDCLKIFQVALYKNPKCFSLWKAYLIWINKELTTSDPEFLRKELERGALVIGHNPNAGFILDLLKSLEKDLLRNWSIRVMFLKFPITNLSQILAETVTWINSLQHEELQMLARHEKLIEVDGTDLYNQDQKIKDLLIQSATKLQQQGFKEYTARQVYESKLVQEEYTPYGASTVDTWRKYLRYIKTAGHFEEIPTIYERALLSQCDHEGLWEQYFLYLEHDLGSSTRVLDLLRNHSLFFSNLSIELQYYWIELEEREAPARARELLIELERKKTLAETFFRHIQLEIRCKDFANAKALYDTLLTVFSSNTGIIAYVVLEYAQFALKYFRDLDFSKKLLKNYFEAYGFNMFLFCGYLQFYIKHVELKETNREIFEEFTNVVLLGLGKAKRAVPHKEYIQIRKVINNLMRDYLNTIFSIKSAEKKIKEQEIMIDKGQEIEIKRPSEYQYESLSTKKKQLS